MAGDAFVPFCLFEAAKATTVRYDRVPHPPLYPPPAHWPACSIYQVQDGHAGHVSESVESRWRPHPKTIALAHVPRASRDSLGEEYKMLYPWLRPGKNAPPPPYPLPSLPVRDLPLMVRLRYMALVKKEKKG